MDKKRREATSFPLWLTRKPLQGKIAATTKKILKELATNTVCQSARCPNIGECFANSTATFLILGNVCTRNCNFCCVNNKGFYPQPDNTEISRIISAVKKLNLKYVVITSVTRDDLKDGGSAHFAKLIITLKKELNGIKIEVLVPDFKGEPDSIRKVIEAKPYIFSHNLETVKVLYSKVRPQADYYISLNVLKIVKELDKSIITKSGIMVGLGETDNQIFELMDDLREVNCDIITIGQYLKPSKQQLDVVKFIEPNKFKYYQNVAYKKGFKYAVSAPFVRSSYNAEKCII